MNMHHKYIDSKIDNYRHSYFYRLSVDCTESRLLPALGLACSSKDNPRDRADLRVWDSRFWVDVQGDEGVRVGCG